VHVLAAIVWVGSNLVLAIAVVPHLREPALRGPVLALLRAAGPRLSRIGWASLVLLLLTGLYNLHVRGLLAAAALTSATSHAIGVASLVKLGGIAVIFLLNAMHDLVWGPAASNAMERDPRGADPETARLRTLARVAGRWGTLISLVLVLAGVVFVRGWF
jgi:uncharacterized membrane protein